MKLSLLWSFTIAARTVVFLAALAASARPGSADFASCPQKDAPTPAMSAPAVQWGILGVGDVCEVKSGPALQDAEGSQLAAVMRRTPGAAEDFAKRHGVPSWYEDAEALVASEQVNAIYIASPPGAHLEHAKLA